MKGEAVPPTWIDDLIDRLAPPHLADEIKGDLLEIFYQDIKNFSSGRASRNYFINALGFLTKRFFWKDNSNPRLIRFFMFASYFKTAQRRLVFHKTNTIINLLGLIVGISAALIIFATVRHELSFDSFHSKRDRIYRVIRVTGPDLSITDRSECRSGVSMPVPFAMRQEIPSFETVAVAQYYGGAQIDLPEKNLKFREEQGCVIVEPDFFNVFDFKGSGFQWISGSPKKSLTEPFSVVLTKSRADKFFPAGDAMGKVIRFDRQVECKVTGIVEDFPLNTDFPFTMLVSYSTILKLDPRMDDWFSVRDDNQAFVVLPRGASKEAFEKMIAKVHSAHTPKDLYESRHYLLQPVSDIHFDTRFGNFNRRTISKETIWSLGLVAAFLLLIACINYINLATAQSALRSKEVGLRKVLGSMPFNLVWQFLIETFLIVSCAGILALALAEIVFPFLQSSLNIQHYGFLTIDPIILGMLLIIVIVVSLISGFYPSLILSRFNPAASLRSRFITESVGGISLRKILVVAQFTITQMLVVVTFIVISQMNFFRTKDMGFKKESIVNLPIPENRPAKLREIESRLRAVTSVTSLSFSWTLPSGSKRNDWYNGVGKKEAVNSSDYQVTEVQPIDTAYLSLYGIKLVAGRSLLLSDTNRNVLINRELVKNLQLGKEQDALGAELKMDNKLVTVVGVVDNFYSDSFKSGFHNTIMLLGPKMFSNVSVKLGRQDNMRATDELLTIEKVWSEVFPEYVFEYRFFDDNVNAFYAQEEKYSTLLKLFSIVFVAISCLGLYGLITFVINRKSKEVAIRKVLGAGLTHILRMFSAEYVQLIAISFLISTPVTYYVMDGWLSNFAVRIPLNWWLFFLPGLLVLSIAVSVVSSKSIAANNSSPIEKLKYE